MGAYEHHWDMKSTTYGIPFVYGLLVACVGIAAGVFIAFGFKPVHVVTVSRIVAPASAAAVARAWGKPDAQVDGKSINAGLSGYTCDQWLARKAVLCYVP